MGSTTAHSWFEALFERRLRPSGPFADALRFAGYDATRALPEYPTEVWLRCLEVAREQRWPDLDRERAYREMGIEFSLGFLETILGRVVGAAISFMTPASFMRRIAGYMRMGRNDDALTMELVSVEPRRVELTITNPTGVPSAFIAGVVDVACRHMRVNHTVGVHQHDVQRATVTVEWT